MKPIGQSLTLPLLVLLLFTAVPAVGQSPGPDTVQQAPAAYADRLDLMSDIVRPLVLAVVYTFVGLGLFATCIWLIVKMVPFSIRKEIEEDQNVALGLILAAMILGIALILSCALIG